MSKKKVDEDEILIFAAELNDKDLPSLDLHGESLEQAKYLLDEFINKNFIHRQYVIKIITGRGSGRLHDYIDKELNASKLVKYYRTSSDPRNAGGSFYAVLWI